MQRAESRFEFVTEAGYVVSSGYRPSRPVFFHLLLERQRCPLTTCRQVDCSGVVARQRRACGRGLRYALVIVGM